MSIVAASSTGTRAESPISGLCPVCGQSIFGCPAVLVLGCYTHVVCRPLPNAKWVALLGEEASAA